MTFIVATTDKYVMLKDQHNSIKLKKNEAFEIDDVNAEFLTNKYEDIKYYVESKNKTNKRNSKSNEKSTSQEEDLINSRDINNNTSKEDDLIDEANTGNKQYF